ncbi:thiamine phosphate synthase [Paenibacillus sp. GSMTC-2017]|uniref:thiamine phosphate synthase n=1 Tax=Paenibacillus sp. GSMTC-2017 TaxID=2794350 RepID=UPI001E3810E7|nr:thiamine phosphate synthase [Paenibacillus sp. GSMTC-2017]
MAIRSNWQQFQLYVITAENNHPGRSLLQVMEQTLIGGADILQLRNKTGTREEILKQAKELRVLTNRYNVPFIVNDYADIALEVDADGVHLGQDDNAIEDARALLGPSKIIGISTHNIEQALAAERAGAHYIGVGPVYPTNTKPGRAAVTTSYVAEAAKRITIPFVAIGGITLSNVDDVLAAGASRICAVSAIVGDNDPAKMCRLLRERIQVSRETNRSGPMSKVIWLNGKSHTTTSENLADLIEQLGQSGKRLVTEVNGIIIQRTAWPETTVSDGATIELVQFVGGG